MLEWILKK